MKTARLAYLVAPLALCAACGKQAPSAPDAGARVLFWCGRIPDGGIPDVGPVQPFGSGMCSSDTEYCYIEPSGDVADADPQGYAICRPLPSACSSFAACACVNQACDQGSSPSCAEDGGAVTVTCH